MHCVHTYYTSNMQGILCSNDAKLGEAYVTCLIIVDIRQQPMTGINTSDIAVMLSHREELFHLYMTSVPIDVGFARS